jgi:hypothetical protein
MRRLRPSTVETGPDALEALHALAAGLRRDGGVLGAAAQAAEQKPARLPPKPVIGLQAGVFGAKVDVLILMSNYQQ